MAKVFMETSQLVKQKVLVIGNGAAGSKVAAYAAKNKNYEVTVVTPFEYMEVSLCMTKAVAAGPEEHAKALYDLLREPGVNYVIDVVTSLTDGVANLQSGSSIQFDVCVVASGQNIPIFYPNTSERTIDARKAAIKRVYDEIQSGANIVVGGAGPVGIEVAADIKLRNKSKKVTVVNHQDEVLAMMQPSYRAVATQQLAKMDIDVISRQRVVSFEKGEVTLENGRKISCDVYIPAFSTGGNTAFLPAGSKDARGYAIVDDTFKVQSMTKVFAVGDCSNYDRVKTYLKIDDQMPILQKNIDALLAKKPLQHHVKGKSFGGQMNWPVMVALGHGLPEGYGVGPALPGCCGACCFICCCGTPSGHQTNKMKSDFNMSVKPKPGKGISS